MSLMKRLVITVHGIRTFGQWQERLEQLLVSESSELIVENYHYGYFSVIAFVLPFFRWFATRRFRAHLLQVANRYPDHTIAIVAHSFGTHLVAWGLRGIPREKRPRVETIVFAGSVLRSSFPWGELLDDGRIGRVINDCGITDVVLILSQMFVLMTGMAGRVGFTGMTGQRLTNRFFCGGHSLYFLDKGNVTDEFMARHWTASLGRGLSAAPQDERTTRGSLQGVALTMMQLADPIKFAAYAAVIGMAFYVGYWRPRVEAAREREQSALEALGRRGHAAMSLLDAGTSLPAAVATLGRATIDDRTAAYPEFRNTLGYWLPQLRTLNTAIDEIPVNCIFSWRGKVFLKTAQRVLEIPERVRYYAFAPDGHLFIINTDAVFSVYQVPPDGSDAPKQILSLGGIDLSDYGALANLERHVPGRWEPLTYPEFYYFPESQRLIMGGRRASSYAGGEGYIELDVDIAGRNSPEPKPFNADAGCLSYFDDPVGHGRGLDNKPREGIQRLCGPYRLGDEITGEQDLHGFDGANIPLPLRFPDLGDEGRLWTASRFDSSTEPAPVVSQGSVTAARDFLKRTYLMVRPDGKRLFIEVEFGMNAGELDVCAPDVGDVCSNIMNRTMPNLVVGGLGTRFYAAVAADLSYLLVVRGNYHGESDWSHKNIVLIPFGRPQPLEFPEGPDEVDAAAFDLNSGKLAMVGDDQLWLFESATRRLLWRRSVDASSPSHEQPNLFATTVPLAVTHQFLITQQRTLGVAAYTKEGEPAWISSNLGFRDTTSLRLAVADGDRYLVAYNGRELRVLLTQTGTFLTPVIEIKQVAKALGRSIGPVADGEDETQLIDRAAVDAQGSLHVFTSNLQFTGSGVLSAEQIEKVLPVLSRHTGISVDGKTPVQSVDGVFHGSTFVLTPTDVNRMARVAQQSTDATAGSSGRARRRVLVIDPGHGGNDLGAHELNGVEKDIDLQIALKLGELVDKEGLYSVVYTRQSDVTVPLEERSALSNRVGASMFLSIHVNSAPLSPAATGAELYCLNFADLPNGSAHSVKEQALEEKVDLSSEIAYTLQRELNTVYYGDPARGLQDPKRAPFVVLIGTVAPAVIAEVGFLTGPEGARLRQPDFQTKIAQALYRGLAVRGK